MLHPFFFFFLSCVSHLSFFFFFFFCLSILHFPPVSSCDQMDPEFEFDPNNFQMPTGDEVDEKEAAGDDGGHVGPTRLSPLRKKPKMIELSPLVPRLHAFQHSSLQNSELKEEEMEEEEEMNDTPEVTVARLSVTHPSTTIIPIAVAASAKRPRSRIPKLATTDTTRSSPSSLLTSTFRADPLAIRQNVEKRRIILAEEEQDEQAGLRVAHELLHGRVLPLKLRPCSVNPKMLKYAMLAGCLPPPTSLLMKTTSMSSPHIQPHQQTRTFLSSSSSSAGPKTTSQLNLKRNFRARGLNSDIACSSPDCKFTWACSYKVHPLCYNQHDHDKEEEVEGSHEEEENGDDDDCRGDGGAKSTSPLPSSSSSSQQQRQQQLFKRILNPVGMVLRLEGDWPEDQTTGGSGGPKEGLCLMCEQFDIHVYSRTLQEDAQFTQDVQRAVQSGGPRPHLNSYKVQVCEPGGFYERDLDHPSPFVSGRVPVYNLESLSCAYYLPETDLIYPCRDSDNVPALLKLGALPAFIPAWECFLRWGNVEGLSSSPTSDLRPFRHYSMSEFRQQGKMMTMTTSTTQFGRSLNQGPLRYDPARPHLPLTSGRLLHHRERSQLDQHITSTTTFSSLSDGQSSHPAPCQSSSSLDSKERFFQSTPHITTILEWFNYPFSTLVDNLSRIKNFPLSVISGDAGGSSGSRSDNDNDNENDKDHVTKEGEDGLINSLTAVLVMCPKIVVAPFEPADRLNYEEVFTTGNPGRLLNLAANRYPHHPVPSSSSSSKEGGNSYSVYWALLASNWTLHKLEEQQQQAREYTLWGKERLAHHLRRHEPLLQLYKSLFVELGNRIPFDHEVYSAMSTRDPGIHPDRVFIPVTLGPGEDLSGHLTEMGTTSLLRPARNLLARLESLLEPHAHSSPLLPIDIPGDDAEGSSNNNNDHLYGDSVIPLANWLLFTSNFSTTSDQQQHQPPLPPLRRHPTKGILKRRATGQQSQTSPTPRTPLPREDHLNATTSNSGPRTSDKIQQDHHVLRYAREGLEHLHSELKLEAPPPDAERSCSVMAAIGLRCLVAKRLHERLLKVIQVILVTQNQNQKTGATLTNTVEEMFKRELAANHLDQQRERKNKEKETNGDINSSTTAAATMVWESGELTIMDAVRCYQAGQPLPSKVDPLSITSLAVGGSLAVMLGYSPDTGWGREGPRAPTKHLGGETESPLHLVVPEALNEICPRRPPPARNHNNGNNKSSSAVRPSRSSSSRKTNAAATTATKEEEKSKPKSIPVSVLPSSSSPPPSASPTRMLESLDALRARQIPHWSSSSSSLNSNSTTTTATTGWPRMIDLSSDKMNHHHHSLAGDLRQCLRALLDLKIFVSSHINLIMITLEVIEGASLPQLLTDELVCGHHLRLNVDSLAGMICTKTKRCEGQCVCVFNESLLPADQRGVGQSLLDMAPCLPESVPSERTQINVVPELSRLLNRHNLTVEHGDLPNCGAPLRAIILLMEALQDGRRIDSQTWDYWAGQSVWFMDLQESVMRGRMTYLPQKLDVLNDLVDMERLKRLRHSPPKVKRFRIASTKQTDINTAAAIHSASASSSSKTSKSNNNNKPQMIDPPLPPPSSGDDNDTIVYYDSDEGGDSFKNRGQHSSSTSTSTSSRNVSESLLPIQSSHKEIKAAKKITRSTHVHDPQTELDPETDRYSAIVREWSRRHPALIELGQLLVLKELLDQAPWLMPLLRHKMCAPETLLICAQNLALDISLGTWDHETHGSHIATQLTGLHTIIEGKSFVRDTLCTTTGLQSAYVTLSLNSLRGLGRVVRHPRDFAPFLATELLDASTDLKGPTPLSFDRSIVSGRFKMAPEVTATTAASTAAAATTPISTPKKKNGGHGKKKDGQDGFTHLVTPTELSQSPDDYEFMKNKKLNYPWEYIHQGHRNHMDNSLNVVKTLSQREHVDVLEASKLCRTPGVFEPALCGLSHATDSVTSLTTAASDSEGHHHHHHLSPTAIETHVTKNVMLQWLLGVPLHLLRGVLKNFIPTTSFVRLYMLASTLNHVCHTNSDPLDFTAMDFGGGDGGSGSDKHKEEATDPPTHDNEPVSYSVLSPSSSLKSPQPQVAVCTTAKVIHTLSTKPHGSNLLSLSTDLGIPFRVIKSSGSRKPSPLAATTDSNNSSNNHGGDNEDPSSSSLLPKLKSETGSSGSSGGGTTTSTWKIPAILEEALNLAADDLDDLDDYYHYNEDTNMGHDSGLDRDRDRDRFELRLTDLGLGLDGPPSSSSSSSSSKRKYGDSSMSLEDAEREENSLASLEEGNTNNNSQQSVTLTPPSSSTGGESQVVPSPSLKKIKGRPEDHIRKIMLASAKRGPVEFKTLGSLGSMSLSAKMEWPFAQNKLQWTTMTIENAISESGMNLIMSGRFAKPDTSPSTLGTEMEVASAAVVIEPLPHGGGGVRGGHTNNNNNNNNKVSDAHCLQLAPLHIISQCSMCETLFWQDKYAHGPWPGTRCKRCRHPGHPEELTNCMSCTESLTLSHVHFVRSAIDGIFSWGSFESPESTSTMSMSMMNGDESENDFILTDAATSTSTLSPSRVSMAQRRRGFNNNNNTTTIKNSRGALNHPSITATSSSSVTTTATKRSSSSSSASTSTHVAPSVVADRLGFESDMVMTKLVSSVVVGGGGGHRGDSFYGQSSTMESETITEVLVDAIELQKTHGDATSSSSASTVHVEQGGGDQYHAKEVPRITEELLIPRFNSYLKSRAKPPKPLAFGLFMPVESEPFNRCCAFCHRCMMNKPHISQAISYSHRTTYEQFLMLSTTLNSASLFS